MIFKIINVIIILNIYIIIFMKEIKLSDFIDIKDKTTYIKWLVKNNNFEIILSYVSDFANTKTLRDIVFVISEVIKLEWKIRNRIILVVDELNNNAIEYGSRIWDINKLKIIIKEKNNWVYINIEVEDSWTWKKTKTAYEMEQISNEKISRWFNWYNSIRWRGLFMIIINLVDKLYFKDSKNGWLIVWIEKLLSSKDLLN